MPSKMTLTPKDCLYLEDSINASYLLIKELDFVATAITDTKVKKHIETSRSSLLKQAQALLKVMEG